MYYGDIEEIDLGQFALVVNEKNYALGIALLVVMNNEIMIMEIVGRKGKLECLHFFDKETLLEKNGELKLIRNERAITNYVESIKRRLLTNFLENGII